VPTPSSAAAPPPDGPRIAIAHEWLVRYAGSGRVVEELTRAFAVERILTTVLERDAMPAALGEAEPSWLQRLPGATAHHEWLQPLMPLAWRLREPLRDVDAVVSSSHACANAVRVGAGIPHVSYCHTPMRYAWDFDAEQARFPAALRPPARAAMGLFRRWDRAQAEGVTRFVANSTAVAGRIRRAYGRDADVVFPPVRTDHFTPDVTAERSRFLFVGRLVAYKRPDLVVEAFRGLEHELVVVGDGQLRRELMSSAPANVSFLESVDDDGLRRLYRESIALVYPAEEDFGIVMAEAQACGTPVIALDKGGAVDIVEDGVTGWLIHDQDVQQLCRAVQRAAETPLDPVEIAARSQRFGPGHFRAQMQRIVQETIESGSPG
jgi:glycosyltransferase involved in cell wall biosynthesis